MLALLTARAGHVGVEQFVATIAADADMRSGFGDNVMTGEHEWNPGHAAGDPRYPNLLLRLMLMLSTGRTPLDMRHRLRAATARCPWHTLSSEEYLSIASEFERECNFPELLQAGSPAMTALGQLRDAVGLVYAERGSTDKFPDPSCYVDKLDGYLNLWRRLVGRSPNSVNPEHIAKLLPEMLTDITNATSPQQKAQTVLLNQIEDLRRLLGAALSVFNVCIISDANSSALVVAVRTSLDDCPTLALPMLYAATYNVSSAATMAALVERCSEHYFAASGFERVGQSSWAVLVANLVIPSRFNSVFVAACLSGRHGLALNAFAAKNSATKTLVASPAVGQPLALNGDVLTFKDIGGWCFRLMDPKSVTSIGSTILLIWARALKAIERQLMDRNALDEANEDALAMLKRLVSEFERLGADRAGSGFLGAFGLGSRSPLPPRLRLVCRALAVSICDELARGCSRKLLLDKTIDKAFQQLVAATESKVYHEIKPVATFALDAIRKYPRPKPWTGATSSLLAALVKQLYAKVPHLAILYCAPSEEPCS